MTNLGKWDWAYEGLEEGDPASYGDTQTYEIGFEWLKDCAVVEDWGCGKGWFKGYFEGDDGPAYVGIDGSHTPFADQIEDLASYVSSVEGIYMRHVLEHNYQWESVLRNALSSFTKKLCVVVFTPEVEETKEIAFNDRYEVPDLAFKRSDLTKIIDEAGVSWTLEKIDSVTQYGSEIVYKVER